jgi:hypothetical protein
MLWDMGGKQPGAILPEQPESSFKPSRVRTRLCGCELSRMVLDQRAYARLQLN